MSEFYSLRMTGCTAYQGAPQIRFEYAGQPITYLPLANCIHKSPEAIVGMLAERDFSLLGGSAYARVREKLNGVLEYPPRAVLDRPGWVGPYAVLPSGGVIAAPAARNRRAVFKPEQALSDECGTDRDWLGVAQLLTRQPLPMFAVGAAFAAPLARLARHHGGFAFEVIDPSGAAARVLPLLAASVTGAVTAAPLPFQAVIADPARHHLLHADALMVVGDPRSALATMTTAQRGTVVISFLRDRPSSIGGDAASGPVSLLMVGQEALVDLMGAATPVGEAVAERIITLRLPAGQVLGAFERLPDGFNSASLLTSHLRELIGAAHGSVYRAFLQRCVTDRANDEPAFVNRIVNAIANFRRHARVDENDQTAVAIVESFGLVYAGLRLARDYGLLPPEWRCGPTVMAVYRRYYASPEPLRPATEIINELAACADVVRLQRGRSNTRRAVLDATMFLRVTAKGRELLIRASAVEDLLPGGERFLSRHDVIPLLSRDGRHRTKWCKPHPRLKRRRMVCLRVSPPVAKTA